MSNQYYYTHGDRRGGRKKHKSSKGFSRLVLFLAIITVCSLLIKINGRSIYAGIINGSNSISKKQLEIEQQEAEAKLNTLNNSVNSVIDNNQNIDFEVSSVDITNDDKQLTYGQSGPMTAGSVSKILTAADYLNEVELGKQSLSQTFEDGDTASYALKQMIVVSDDDAWEDLNDQLSYLQLQDYANKIGVNSYQWQNNTLSAYDTANLLAKLYEGKLLNKEYTDLLLGYLKQANYREFIVPAVPSYDTVYHKIGEYNDNVNDAAIITNKNQSIVVTLAIFTNGNGTYQWTQRAEMMQQITKAFLTYYGLIS